MIVVKVYGGLGNQMFQYAFYKYLQLCNDNIYLDISDYNVHKHHHGFELSNIFGINVEQADLKKLKCCVSNQNSISYRFINKILHKHILGYSDFLDFQDVSIIRKEKFTNDIYFTGFWQDASYVKPVENELRETFQFIKPITGEQNLDLLSILETKESVSVHIRRGDYLQHSHFSGICDVRYYFDAINIIKSKVNNPNFIIFSDDISWCKGVFGTGNDYIYVDWNTGYNSFIDMQLMSICKHNIIANSTFSWWGAWLNKNPNKIIICPKIWNRNKTQNYLFIEEWIAI
jgi:hypothetical protein